MLLKKGQKLKTHENGGRGQKKKGGWERRKNREDGERREYKRRRCRHEVTSAEKLVHSMPGVY